ncbi:MAG TPA: GH116 family glycosyl hydrolase [Saprospiraceae bacterium]|nr:GH116 family glycosyl hydrolase [Saprospiraceae bacterium]
MSKKNSRRTFFKQTVAGTTASILSVPALQGMASIAGESGHTTMEDAHVYNGAYSGENLNRIAFPIGGIGAGMFCIEGTGAISHLSIRHQPAIFNEPPVFAGLSVKGKPEWSRILEGPVPAWKKFGQRDSGNGSTGATTGLPRYGQAAFTARFPFATINLQDLQVPFRVELTGWSPFIPGDENNSGMPVGAFEYKISNAGTQTHECLFSFNSAQFLKIDKGKNAIRPTSSGFILEEAGTEEKPFKTEFAVFTDEPGTIVDHCWFRGGWWDPLTMAWNAVRDAKAKAVDPVEQGAPGASLYVPFSLAPGKSKTIRLYFAWYCPESDSSYGKMGIRKENCDPSSGCCNSPSDIGLDKYDQDFNGQFYKPWYSNRFKSIQELISYWKAQYEDLKNKSTLFKQAFYASTLPASVIEAVAANLTILKSPTVRRQYDGRLWNFEGCGESWGCCHGSCTHVWNYAQAIPHLFPALERSLRHTEFCESQDEKGHQNFRSNLPIQPTTHDFHAAADGQLGGIMKAYREWRISGDETWLEKMFPLVKKSLDYCIETWDPERKGTIEEPHHNTYDIEFWGSDGMHNSFYIGALQAIIRMGQALNRDMKDYESLLARARDYMENKLYNGEFFIQQVQVEGLKAPNPATVQSFGGEYSREALELLQKEGPKYQYGSGCLADGILGIWIARMCGLEDILDKNKIKSHLVAVHKYNLKSDLSTHANPQRPSFALGKEGGLLLCTWPKGGKPALPFVYSDEVWTGIEHQVAAHLMLTGEVTRGLDILDHCRRRYDGKVRNPFNEYECGHWYARALSSYGYLQSLTGLRYDAVDKTLYIDPRTGDFTSFLSTEKGFGTVSLKGNVPRLKLYHGAIEVAKVLLKGEEVKLKMEG